MEKSISFEQEVKVIFNLIREMVKGLVKDFERVNVFLIIAQKLEVKDKNQLKEWAKLLTYKPERVVAYIEKWVDTDEKVWLNE